MCKENVKSRDISINVDLFSFIQKCVPNTHVWFLRVYFKIHVAIRCENTIRQNTYTVQIHYKTKYTSNNKYIGWLVAK